MLMKRRNAPAWTQGRGRFTYVYAGGPGSQRLPFLITVFLILKDTSGFFQYVVVNLWCWASTIMPEASQKVAETAEITKTAPQTKPKSRKRPGKK